MYAPAEHSTRSSDKFYSYAFRTDISIAFLKKMTVIHNFYFLLKSIASATLARGKEKILLFKKLRNYLDKTDEVQSLFIHYYYYVLTNYQIS